MIIELPDKEFGALHLTNDQARIELAVGLYSGGKVTLGQAAKIAGTAYTVFMHEIGRRGVTINYTLEDAQQDIETVRNRLAK